MGSTVNRLFVYGIFLDEDTRRDYGMYNPEYATVIDYATVGDYIVQARHMPNLNLSLTGLLVDVSPVSWGRIDALESAYDRVIVETSNGEAAYMYVEKAGRYESKR